MGIDRYDRAIAALNSGRGSVYRAWHSTSQHPGGELFEFVSPTGVVGQGIDERCGCLTQIRASYLQQLDYKPSDAGFDANWVAAFHAVAVDGGGFVDVEMTLDIGCDDRIPSDPDDVRPEDYAVFAYWQRRLDEHFGRDAGRPGPS